MQTYKLFLYTQALSQLGSGMTAYAMTLYVFNKTGSTLNVSLLTFFTLLPRVFVSTFIGGFIDSHKKKTLIFYADIVTLMSALVLLFSVLSGKLNLPVIYSVCIIIGIANAIQMPSSNVALSLLIKKDEQIRASGLSSIMESINGVLTPALATAIYSAFGFGAVIIIDISTCILAELILIFGIKIEETALVSVTDKKASYKEGFKFIFSNPPIRIAVLNTVFTMFISQMTYVTALPSLILLRTNENHTVLSIVEALLSIGNIAGGILVSTARDIKNPFQMKYIATAISFLVGDIVLGLSKSTVFWCIGAFLSNLPLAFIIAGENLIAYREVPTEIRGRYFSSKNAMSNVLTPLGTLLGGVFADKIFEPFIKSGSGFALFFGRIVGNTAGCGISLMFLCTGVLGTVVNLISVVQHHRYCNDK